MSEKKVLIIEDDQDIIDVIEFNLKKEGFSVISSKNGIDGLEKIKKLKPDIVVLDVMLPGIDGFSILRNVKIDKEISSIPIIMLTARDCEIDKINGLESGADDYISKPFSIRELIARIKVVLKRYNKDEELKLEFSFGRLYINFERYQVFIGDKEVNLTSKEFQILKEFVLSKGKLLTRDYLLSRVWNIISDIETRTLDVHIMNLRKKLKEYGKLIETVKNIGYRFKVDDKGFQK